MKHETYENLYAEFKDALTGVSSIEGNPIQSLSEALAVCRKFLAELRAMVRDATFSDSLAEIHFFKSVKPKFYAEKIFVFERYGLEMNKPVGTVEMIRAFLEDELRQVHRFFKQHAFLYQYYRSGGVEMDSQYFLRGGELPLPLVPEIPDPNPDFSTAMDYLFAKFIAYEMLQQEILRRIGLLDGKAVPVGDVDLSKAAGLKWTGKIVNLGELIYGLYYTGQFNHGNAQLSEIVALFERMCSVKIRDVHHTFGEIRERKVSSPSKFIDSMAAAIRDRVDEDLRYKPG
jgi:hypothetical protein